MEKKRIKVIKLCSGGTGFTVPGRQHRSFTGENATKLIEREELEEAMYDDDCKRVFTFGLLWVDDKEFRIEFELATPEEMSEIGIENENQIIVLNKKQVTDMFYALDLKDFEEKFNNFAPATKELVLEVAKTNSAHAGYDKNEFIKRVFNVDVDKVKQMMREEAAELAASKAKKA